MDRFRVLASGRDCDIYDAGPGLVRRRYRDGRSAESEARLLDRVGRLGYPVPRVHSWSGPEIVMELAEGPTLAEAIGTGQVTASGGARLLAGLHHDLHRLDWDGSTLTHRDLHPLNVIVAERGPVVIDWSNAAEGPAALDEALTLLIMAQAAITPEMTAGVHPGLQPLIPAFLKAFVKQVGTAYRRYLSAAAEIRTGDPNTSALERANIRAALERIP